jgi:hypothetical protein
VLEFIINICLFDDTKRSLTILRGYSAFINSAMGSSETQMIAIGLNITGTVRGLADQLSAFGCSTADSTTGLV